MTGLTFSLFAECMPVANTGSGVQRLTWAKRQMPFDYRNRKTFAVKLVLFTSTGFAIPFIAAYYQLYVRSALPCGLERN